MSLANHFYQKSLSWTFDFKLMTAYYVSSYWNQLIEKFKNVALSTLIWQSCKTHPNKSKISVFHVMSLTVLLENSSLWICELPIQFLKNIGPWKGKRGILKIKFLNWKSKWLIRHPYSMWYRFWTKSKLESIFPL